MSDNKQIINCPACGKEMVKVFDKDKEINIDICLNGCGGIFFDNRELEKFNNEHKCADEILNAIKNKEFAKVDETEKRTCPICNRPMVKMGAGIDGVEIDVCNTCGAKFLDNGELEKIRVGEAIDLQKFDAKLEAYNRENNINVKSSPRRQFFEDLVKSHLLK